MVPVLYLVLIILFFIFLKIKNTDSFFLTFLIVHFSDFRSFSIFPPSSWRNDTSEQIGMLMVFKFSEAMIGFIHSQSYFRIRFIGVNRFHTRYIGENITLCEEIKHSAST